MSSVVIIGVGTVGTNLSKELAKLNPDLSDRYKGIYPKDDFHDYGFICVDTPLINNRVDISQVEEAMRENPCDVYILKSTCPVGTLDYLEEKGYDVVFSPEYYGGTQHCNNFEFNFTILGGNKYLCYEVIQLLQKCYDGRHVFKVVEGKVAELVKFMENSYLATKVSFCNAFYDICQIEDIPYEELRECFILDPRVHPSHTFVYEDTPFWDSHCLNKDVPSIADQYDNKFLKNLVKYNEERRLSYDTESVI